MASQNTINSLESIQKKTIYSKYGENLNRIFNTRSLKSLIYELKNPKKPMLREILDTQEFQIKKPKEKKEDDYTDIFNSVQNYLKNEAKKEARKEMIKKKIQDKSKIKNERNIIEKHEFKDPFKYNPNYNAVSKNVPSVKMILTEREKNEMKKKEEENKRNKHLKLIHSKTESGDKKNKILLEIVDVNNNSKKIETKTRNTELPLITNVPKQKERSITVENNIFNKKINMRNNHAMRFSKYLSRQINFNEKDKDNQISYLEPYKYLDNKSKVIDFRKMSSRKPRDFLLISVLENPSFNNYNPKYDLVEKKTSQVDFSPHINKQNSKKYLLRKIWGSYDVVPGYQLVNNAQLS